MSSRTSDGRFVLIWMAVMFGLMVLPVTVIGGIAVARSTPVESSGPEPGTTVDTCPDLAGLTGVVNDHGGEVVAGATFEVLAGDSFFGPTCALEVPSGQVEVTFTNVGQILHNVSIPDQGIDVDMAPGETVTISVSVEDQPVGYFCKYHRTTGMVGVLMPQV